MASARKHEDADLFMDVLDKLIVPVRGKGGVDNMIMAKMVSLDEVLITADTEAFVYFVVKDKENVWKAQADGDEETPEPVFTQSRKFMQKGFPFNREGLACLKAMQAEVTEHRGDKDGDGALMDKIRERYNARVDEKLKKRKASQEALKMRKAARANDDANLHTAFSDQQAAAMREFLSDHVVGNGVDV